MSTLLAYNFQSLALGLSPAAMASTVDGLFTTAGWQRIRGTIQPTAYVGAVNSSSGATVANVFDGYDIFTLNLSVPYNGNVGVQLASPVTVAHVTIFRGGVSSAQLTGFVVESSTDGGATWTVCGTYAPAAGWNPGEPRDFPVVGASAAAAWRVRGTATDGSNHDWDVGEIRMFTTTGDYISGELRSYFLPPNTELVGNGSGRDVLAVVYSGTTIRFVPEIEYPNGFPPIIVVQNTVGEAGAVTVSLTINGNTVSITGAAGNTSQANHRLLYEAIRSSSNAAFTDYAWTWQSPATQNANDTSYLIFGVKTAISAPGTVTATNATVFVSGALPAFHRTGSPDSPNVVSVSVDLINGCVLFYQISNRAVTFATRANTTYAGPMHAAWGDHAKALAVMPTSLDARLITPIELLVGMDNTQANADSWAIPSHCWGLSYGQSMATGFMTQASYGGGHPANGLAFRGMFTDGEVRGHSGMIYAVKITLQGSALFTGTDAIGNDYQIHAEGMTGLSLTSTNFTSGGGGDLVVPIVDMEDWYKFVGTATNEALALAQDIAPVTTLNQAMDNVSSYTTLALADATNLAAAGTLILEDEVITYASKSGNTATSPARAQQGSPMQAHWVGDKVYQGLWFTIIGGGALYAGTTKPS